MTPVTLIIDRTFPGVGRIKKASGTTNPAVKRKINRMLTALNDDGRTDILRAIRDNKLSLMEVHDAYQRRALDQLPTAETVRGLVDAMTAWVDSLRAREDDAERYDYSRKHITALGTTLGYLRAAAPKATLADLPKVLEKLRDSLGKPHPRSFNLARAHAMAFVRATMKRSHPLYLAVVDVDLRKVPKRAPRPDLAPDWMRAMFPSPETDAVDSIAWSMATTGMGAEEYWGKWTTMADRVRVYGTKREARVRDVPLVRTPTAPAMHRRTFEDKVRERTNRAIEPYDLRRCFSRWMESAGVPRIRRKMYMGHATGDVTELYERHEVEAYLIADAAKVRQWLGLPTNEPPTLRLEKAE